MEHNLAVMHQKFGNACVHIPMQHRVPQHIVASGILATFLDDPKFHELQCVAVHCRVIFTDTVNESIGAVNGAMGVVLRIYKR